MSDREHPSGPPGDLEPRSDPRGRLMGLEVELDGTETLLEQREKELRQAGLAVALGAPAAGLVWWLEGTGRTLGPDGFWLYILFFVALLVGGVVWRSWKDPQREIETRRSLLEAQIEAFRERRDTGRGGAVDGQGRSLPVDGALEGRDTADLAAEVELREMEVELEVAESGARASGLFIPLLRIYFWIFAVIAAVLLVVGFFLGFELLPFAAIVGGFGAASWGLLRWLKRRRTREIERHAEMRDALETRIAETPGYIPLSDPARKALATEVARDRGKELLRGSPLASLGTTLFTLGIGLWFVFEWAWVMWTLYPAGAGLIGLAAWRRRRDRSDEFDLETRLLEMSSSSESDESSETRHD